MIKKAECYPLTLSAQAGTMITFPVIKYFAYFEMISDWRVSHYDIKPDDERACTSTTILYLEITRN